MAVTVNSLSQQVELTEPVHIVISDNSSPRPFIWQSLKDLTFVKISGLRWKLLRAALKPLTLFEGDQALKQLRWRTIAFITFKSQIN